MRTREEPWGRLVYDKEWDEFEAHVCDESIFRINGPISAGCLVTGRCNLECAFCYGNHEALPAREMAANEWRKAFSRLSSWGLMRVDLSGGEPTLRKDLPEIANAAIAEGLNVVLSTNGLVLHREGPGRLPKEIRLHVSIDSGFTEIHESSRQNRSLKPFRHALEKTFLFVQKCLDQGYRTRILTCVGQHNAEGLFELGEMLALHRVREWNISRVLSAGRAQAQFKSRWTASEALLLTQVADMREAYPWMRIRYSNRTEQDGYFLLVLPDGTLATQYTDGRDKVPLGNVLRMSISDFRLNSLFRLQEHARKWIAASLYCQDPSCKCCYSEAPWEAA